MGWEVDGGTGLVLVAVDRVRVGRGASCGRGTQCWELVAVGVVQGVDRGGGSRWVLVSVTVDAVEGTAGSYSETTQVTRRVVHWCVGMG